MFTLIHPVLTASLGNSNYQVGLVDMQNWQKWYFMFWKKWKVVDSLKSHNFLLCTLFSVLHYQRVTTQLIGLKNQETFFIHRRSKCTHLPLAYHHISYLGYHHLHSYCRIFGKNWMPQQYIGIRQQLISQLLIQAGKQCDIEHVLEIPHMNGGHIWHQCGRGAPEEWAAGFTWKLKI